MTITPFETFDLTARDELISEVMLELDDMLTSDQTFTLYDVATRLANMIDNSSASDTKLRIQVSASMEQPCKNLVLKPGLIKMVEAAELKYQFDIDQ